MKGPAGGTCSPPRGSRAAATLQTVATGAHTAAITCFAPLLFVEDLAAAAAAAAEMSGVCRLGNGGGVRLATDSGEALCFPAERAERGSSFIGETFIGEAARDGVGVV